MNTSIQELSNIGRDIRSRARSGRMHYGKACRTLLFREESTYHALELALENYEISTSNNMLMLMADLYVVDGQRTVAENIFKSLHYQGVKLHVTNLIYAGIDATVALVDDKQKLLFIPIPKCGSSTVKNYFTTAIHGDYLGERVHFAYPELYRVVSTADLATKYADYYKFSVVRDPIKRVVSYFTHNVDDGSLAQEAFGVNNAFGCPTRPGPFQVRQNFERYIQIFKDFRHHTDPIGGYLNPFKGQMDKIYQMSELDELRLMLSDKYNCKLTDERAMVSKSDRDLVKKCNKVFSSLREFYEDDYKTYIKGA